MLTASDALRDLAKSRALIVQCLQQPPHCMDFFDFKPHADSALSQFIRSCENRHGDWLEVSIVKAAHHSFHKIAMDLAQRRLAGEEIDLEAEASEPNSELGKASAALVAAIWRLERRLHSMAD